MHSLSWDRQAGELSIQDVQTPVQVADWITSILVHGDTTYIGDMGGHVTIVSGGETRTVAMPSGVWSLVQHGDEIFAATRRDGVARVPLR